MNCACKRLLGRGGAVVFAALFAVSAHSDEKADALLKKVAATAQAAKTLTADMKLSASASGQNMDSQGTVKLKKPNFARIVVTGGKMDQTLASDGKNLWIYVPAGNQYMKMPADTQPPFFQGVMMQFPGEIAIFLNPKNVNPFAGAAQDTVTRYVGTETIAGKEVQVVELSGKSPLAYSLKYDINAQNIIQRAVMSLTAGQQTIKMTVALDNIVLDAPLADADFAYTPPKDAKEMKQKEVHVSSGESNKQTQAPNEEPNYEAKLVPVGKDAPKFSLPTPTGGHIALDDALNGRKAVLVNFWFAS